MRSAVRAAEDIVYAVKCTLTRCFNAFISTFIIGTNIKDNLKCYGDTVALGFVNAYRDFWRIWCSLHNLNS